MNVGEKRNLRFAFRRVRPLRQRQRRQVESNRCNRFLNWRWKARGRNARRNCSKNLPDQLRATPRPSAGQTTPYVNTIPPEQQPPYPGRPRHRAPHQELHPLERDGDGGEGEFDHKRRRAYLDVRLVGDALRSGVQSFFPRARRKIFPATSFIFRVTPRRACMRARFSKAGWTSSICKISGRNSPRAAGCRRIRIRI